MEMQKPVAEWLAWLSEFTSVDSQFEQEHVHVRDPLDLVDIASQKPTMGSDNVTVGFPVPKFLSFVY